MQATSFLVEGSPLTETTGLRRRSVFGTNEPNASEPSAREQAPPMEERPLLSDKERRDMAERAFECNVCLELAHDPVVTICGHLHCWPCLYRWKVAKDSQECPVCKAQLTDDKIIPLYGRGMNAKDPRKNLQDNIPQRPAAQRPPTAPQPGVGNLGILPLLGVMPAGGVGGHSGLLYGEPAGPDSQQQAFLSRLLLMLGSFVILCLLVF